MPSLHMVLDAHEVNAFLQAHGLEWHSVPIVAALLQHEGMSSGQPAVMLIVEVDGKKLVAKTSLQILETMCAAMRAASGVEREA